VDFVVYRRGIGFYDHGGTGCPDVTGSGPLALAVASVGAVIVGLETHTMRSP
jgi:hypothetical protein